MDQRVAQTQHTVSKRKPRGKLDQTKCDCCRRDKQKCEPRDRKWPQKCRRCERKGFDCSPSTRKGRMPTNVKLLHNRVAAGRAASEAEAEAEAEERRPNSEHSSASELSSVLSAESTQLNTAGDWTLVDFTNAVSFLTILKRAEVKLQRWYSELDFPFNGTDSLGNSRAAALSLMVQTFSSALQILSQATLRLVTARITALSPYRDQPAAREASYLRILTCEILESPYVGRYNKNDAPIQTADDETIDTTIRGMVSSDEIGPALLLAGKYLGKNRHQVRDLQADLHRYLSLRDQFRPIVKRLWVHLEATVCDELERMLISMVVNNPIVFVFDSPHLLRKLADMEGFWRVQDCLGSSVLHILLEGLGPRMTWHSAVFPIGVALEHGQGTVLFSPGEWPQLVRKIVLHCRQHNPNDICGRSAIRIAKQYGVPEVAEGFLSADMHPGVAFGALSGAFGTS